MSDLLAALPPFEPEPVPQTEAEWEERRKACLARQEAFIRSDDDREECAEWVDKMDEDDRKYLPRRRLVKYLDLLERAWGWERLVPLDRSQVDMATYIKYLEEYYNHNALDYVAAPDQNPRNWPLKSTASAPAPSAATNGENVLAAVSEFMEQVLLSQWKSRYPDRKDHAHAIVQGNLIIEHARSIIYAWGEFSAITAAALVCIAKEADLIREFLRHGAKADDSFIMQSTNLRTIVLTLMAYGLQKVRICHRRGFDGGHGKGGQNDV
ncbi:hypothetical protein ACP4OV_029248 [Aristida adscensionis]